MNSLASFIIVALVFAAAFPGASAQALYSRDSKITLAPNATLSVRGGVENEGTIINNGHFKVSGPWINSGIYQSGDGEITFNGRATTVPQIIHHNGQTFNRITVTGGTKKVLLSDATVVKAIIFDNGIVEAAGNSKIVFESEADIIGASDSSHINGLVVQKGSGHKLFPLGNGSVYLPVELPDVQDPTAHIVVQALEFGNGSLVKPSAVESISEERYWRIDVKPGSVINSPVILPLRDESWSADAESIIVVQSESATADFTSIGRSMLKGTPNNGRIQSELKVSMPFVALASKAAGSELVVYNAVSNNGDDLNEFLRIENIQNYPVNRFSVFSRWGDKIFEIENYDNLERVFRGWSNINGGSELVTGTYFYVLEIPGRESLRGFIAVKN